MIFALTTGQKKILSVLLVLLFIVIIYLLVRFALRNFKKSKQTKMLTLNQVIKFKKFTQFVNFQIDEKERYILYLVSINNFNQLKELYKDSNITAYLKRVAKNMSIYLPYGGKLAQTKQRETFIIYVPNTIDNIEEFGNTLKAVASEVYLVDGNAIQKNNNVSYLLETTGSLEEQLNRLSMALIESKRNLGKIIEATPDLNISITDYRDVNTSINTANINVNQYDTYLESGSYNNESYYTLSINNGSLLTYVKRQSVKDRPWVNMWINEMLLNTYSLNEVKSNINIPIVLSTLQQRSNINLLTRLIEANMYNIDQVIITLLDDKSNNVQEVIESILELKNLGFKISYEVEEINQPLYQTIQSYHLDRIELSPELFNNKGDVLDELLYFAKVNHLEVLVKNSINELETFKNENISHVTKLVKNNVRLTNMVARKRGNK